MPLNKTQVLSESEMMFGERYSKRSVNLVSLEKSGMSIWSQLRKGFMGKKTKPNHGQITKTNTQKSDSESGYNIFNI